MFWNISGAQLFAIIPMISRGIKETAAQIEEDVKTGNSQRLEAMQVKLQKAESAFQQLIALATLYENSLGEWPSEFSGIAVSMRHITSEDRKLLIKTAASPEAKWLAKTHNGFMVAVGNEYRALPLSESFSALVTWADSSGYQWLELSLNEKLLNGFPVHGAQSA